MSMPENIKFERRKPSDLKRKDPKRDLRHEIKMLDRVQEIDREELEARIFLAEKEASFRGIESPGKKAAAEILDAYNAVVADGRHVGLFREHPKQAAELVGVELGDEAADWIIDQGSLGAAIDFARKYEGIRPVGGAVANPAVVAVAVVVVVLEVTESPGEEFVIDQSGQMKF